MRFFQISSRPQRKRVATRMTNSSEFGDKLKAERIAHFKRLFLRPRIFCLRPPMLFLLKPEFRFRPVISLAKYSLVASQARAKSCRVATRATFSAILSRKFQFWWLFSCDFFTCRVASSRVATRAIFFSRWRRDKIWKNRIPCASKQSLVQPRLKGFTSPRKVLSNR